MTNEPLLRVALHGERFKEGEMPLSIIADIAILQEMMVEAAKWQFMKEHPDRQRIPRNFSQIYLKLTGLEKGSTVAKIEIDTTRDVLAGVPYQNYFKKGIDQISDIIGCAEKDTGQPTITPPPQFLSYFNRFGRNLGKNEHLEVKTTGRDPVRLTPKSREQLVFHSTKTELMRDTVFRGTIFEANQNKMTFSFQPIHGSHVNCKFTEQHRDEIITALKHYQNVKVLMHGTGIYDKQDHLTRIESITHVEQLESLDVPARLDELRKLQDGWLDGDDGVAPNHEGLDWLSETFERYYPNDLQLPRTYPTAEGGVSLEWSVGNREIDMEVNLVDRTGEWFVFNKDSKRCDEDKELNLDSSDDWKWISVQLQSLIGE
ncbi:MAG: hypothetical protein F4W68_06525 [Cenarchaeum sp. SB0661_bin_35]|nr:hypothetical protein [Cenarchaeum sp. SB0667_bin_13]MYB47330.1 hypothetical protein [Cenarchaeum sp. SB0662_bin_33]MYC80131.1 hypothetical protein [Cenarchaeum sp. SB0661_bin_35]